MHRLTLITAAWVAIFLSLAAPAHAATLDVNTLALIHAGRFDEAVPILEGLCRNDAGDYEAHYFLAYCHAARRDSDAALRCYRRCTEIDAHRADAYYNLGVLYSELNRWDDAIKNYRVALLSEPGRSDVNFNCGLAYLRRGEPVKAIPYFREAIELNASDTRATFYLALAYESIDRGVAAHIWESYLAASPPSPSTDDYRETALGHLAALRAKTHP